MKRFAAGKTMNLDDPVATALRVARLLERAEIPYALYGGLAVAAYGVARETKDADVAVVSADAGRLAGLLQKDGLSATPAFERMTFGGLRVSRVTVIGVDEDLGLNTVDLVEPTSARYATLAIERAVRAPLRDREIALLAPEDVVIFKVLSTREKDLDDAAAMLQKLTSQIDAAAIASEIERLAGEIQDHDVGERWHRCQGR